ncbi:MAG TPA: hypothetical protein ENI23_17705 [bacterium]|nr:hypothetical protein [bacterium]
MLDIDFLQRDKPQLKHTIVYETDSRAFSPAVFNRIKTMALEKGLGFREVEYDSYWLSFCESSLFGESLVYVDLAKFQEIVKKDFRKLMEQSIQVIVDKSVESRFYFLLNSEIPGIKVIQNLTIYTSFISASTYLEEPKLTKGSFLKVLKYLQDSADWYDFANLKNPTAFEKSMEEVFLLREMNLLEFIKKFDLVGLLAIDEVSNKFDQTKFRNLIGQSDPMEYFKVHRAMFDFLTAFDARSTKIFFRHIDTRFNLERTPIKLLIFNLYRTLQDLQLINGTLNSKQVKPDEFSNYKYKILTQWKNIPLSNLLKFSVGLSKAEPTLNTENFLITMDQMLSDCIA